MQWVMDAGTAPASPPSVNADADASSPHPISLPGTRYVISVHGPLRHAFWPQALATSTPKSPIRTCKPSLRPNPPNSSLPQPPIMPPKSRIHQLAPPPAGYVPPPPKPATTTTSKPAARSTSSKLGSSATAQEVLEDVWSKYVKNTPQRVKLLDSFMAFLVVVGALQFVYCCIVGNFVRCPPSPCFLLL
jgi:hypothetical protein